MTVTNADLAEIAKNIGESGAAGDGLMVLLVKGMTDAQGHLADIATRAIDMAKGKKGKPACDDDDSDDDDSDEGDSGGDGADKKPGYEDMQLAVPGAVVLPAGAPAGDGFGGAPPSGVTHIDVTAYIFETGDQIRTLAKASQAQGARIEQLVESNRLLTEQNASLAKMVEASTAATTGILAPLAKAVVETRNGLLNSAAPGITPVAFPITRVTIAEAAPVDHIGGSARREQQVLAKAMSNGLIDITAKERFRRERKFSADPATHTDLSAKVDELVKELDARP